uniref:zinc finger protein 585B-like n=1 Tax=Anopheles coluzzii TaxID=1518534 RepID=UPI0020FFB7F0|nr:zinc finger protein 585B-like [Anopheles coluzzii]XP_040232897.2 zinc finger protein 585B-like [Anopheles coluzzii]
MCAAGPCFDWYADAEGDVCDMLPLITVNDNSVIATEVTFDAGEFLPPAGEELPYATDFALYGDHRQLFAEISEESGEPQSHEETAVSLESVLTCNGCNVRFQCKTHHTRHQLLHHGDELASTQQFAKCRIRCRQCGEHFPLARQLADHLAAQHSQCSVCELCLATFRDRASLEWHRNYHRSLNQSPKARYTCDVCRKECNSSSHLHLHRKIHLEHKPYPCTYGCNRSFSSSGNRQKHIARMHTHEKKFHCAQCGESFIYARQLHTHRERKHAELTKNTNGFFRCARCKDTFDTEDTFRQHLKTNNGCLEHRAFECVLCAKRFKQSTHLRNHLLTHTNGVRAHGCEHCSKRFTLPGDLKVHRRTHTKEKPFRCNLCPAGFIVGKQLNKHRAKVHGIESTRKG